MMNIEILYEDRDIIVCVKPHGVPSQSDRSSAMDMISWIKNHLAAESGKKGGFYVGAVSSLNSLIEASIDVSLSSIFPPGIS